MLQGIQLDESENQILSDDKGKVLIYFYRLTMRGSSQLKGYLLNICPLKLLDKILIDNLIEI